MGLGKCQCEPTLAKFLGVSHSIGNAMSYFILKSTGYILTRSTVQPITNIERDTDGFKYNTKVYLDRIAVIMNKLIHIIVNNKLFHIIPIEEDKDFILEYRNSTLNNNLLEPDSDSKSTSINFDNKNNDPTPDTVGIALPRIGHDHPQLAGYQKE